MCLLQFDQGRASHDCNGPARTRCSVLACQGACEDVVPGLPVLLLAEVLIWAVPGPVMLLVIRRAALCGVHLAMATMVGLDVRLYA